MSERRVDVATARYDSAVLGTNKVLKNTYMLLGMTLAFSAVTAGISMALNLPAFMGLVFSLIGFGLLFVVNKMADSAKGLPAIFAFTGVMGAGLGPLLNAYFSDAWWSPAGYAVARWNRIYLLRIVGLCASEQARFLFHDWLPVRGSYSRNCGHDC